MKSDTLRTILAPGIAVTNRLSFARKFLALGIFSLVAVAVALVGYYRDVNGEITSARSELLGLVLMKEHAHAMRYVQQHRGWSSSLQGGLASIEPVRVQKEAEAAAAIQSLRVYSADTARASVLWQNIVAAWERIRAQNQQWAQPETVEQHTLLLIDMLQMQTLIADDFGLTADPSLDAYYLAHIASTELPNLLEYLDRLRASGAALLTSRQASEKDLVNIGTLVTFIEHMHDVLTLNLDKARVYNPTLQQRLDAESHALAQAIRLVVDLVTQDVLTRQFDTPPERFLALVTAAIDNGYAQMRDTLLPTTEQLVRARIQNLERQFAYAALAAALILMAVAYLMMAIYFTTLGSVQALSRLASDYAAGNLQSRVSIESQDELKLIGDSFNDMADELADLIEARAEAATQTQAILENMVDGLITIDAHGTMLSFNEAATRIFGYAPGEAIGNNVRMLMPSPHRERHDSYLRGYEQTGVARIIGIGREMDGQRKDGSSFPLGLAVSEVRRQGKPMYVGVVRDLSDSKRNDQLKREFVSTVSHELRTPLTAIAGTLKLMTGGVLGEMPEQSRQAIDIAVRNAQRLRTLIDDLLDIEKLAAGMMAFDLKRQPLTPLVEQAVNQNRPFGVDRHVNVILGDLVTAEAMVDGHRLIQAITNLISNAIKYSPEGSDVHVVTRKVGGAIRIVVEDHGSGIPAAFRSRIFQRFSQADSSDTRSKGGTGLGLAITCELVRQMGGKIDYDSIEGRGSSFYIELPSAAEADYSAA